MPTERKILLALFAIALGIRVLYGAVTAAETDALSRTFTRDFRYAQQIASDFRWISQPVSPRSPGYPAALATLYLISAKQLWLVTFLQAALGALTVVIVYRLGRLLLGVPFATLAALWFAFHGRHIHASSVFERDVLSVLLFVLVVFLIVKPFSRIRDAVVSGLAYAALIHVDPQFVLLAPVWIAFFFFKTRHVLFNFQYLFVFLGIVLVASVPWTVRNYAVYDQPVAIALEARRYLRPVKLPPAEPITELSDLKAGVVRTPAAQRIRRNALEFWRVARFRDNPPDKAAGASDSAARGIGEAAWSRRHNAVSIANYGLLLPFFVAGVALSVRRRQRAGLMLAATIAAYFLVRAYFGGSEHTRLPVDPLIVLLAFYGIEALWQRFRRKATAPV